MRAIFSSIYFTENGKTYNMPDYFSHSVAAEKIFERLDGSLKSQIKSKPLYLLGAQGGDIFFTYNFKFSKSNLGSEIHRMDPEELFSVICRGNPSYAAGFAAHYALDSKLHPVVYAYEYSHKGPFLHQRFEADLGLFISKFYHVRRSILPRDTVLSCTGPVYDTIKPVAPRITVTGVERCLKRHFNYTRQLFRTKRQSYKCDYDFSSLAGAAEDAVEFGKECVKRVLTQDIDGAIFKDSFLQK